jgi:hypothetical protein
MIREFVIVVVAAIITNAQCYGTCATLDCHPTEPSSSDSCHHHQQSPPTGGVCQHQPARLTSTENAAKLSQPPSAGSATFTAVLVQQEHSSAFDVAINVVLIQDTSPPGLQTSPGSIILRI